MKGNYINVGTVLAIRGESAGETLNSNQSPNCLGKMGRSDKLLLNQQNKL